MELHDIPLRELKKAKTKVALYESTLTLLGRGMFRDVMLDDICRMAGISRVTFFNLFRKKEDLLVYFMRLWLTWRIIEIGQQRLRGFAAIRHLFAQAARQTEEYPGIMPSLIAFLSEMNMHPCMPELSLAEVLLLFPGHDEEGMVSPDMFALFHRCVLEAAEDGTLRQSIPPEHAVQCLFTAFYGAFLTSQLYADSDVMAFYEVQLRLIEEPSHGNDKE
ncbi:TetR/AcrR family transcriptional regulator [Paenibacillus sp. XY044]|uniref:TetR/AcrR family transcriptional regulator n=1 Tax=Paenibacillus sp. XY044 TaxID=2026089 RepID=UPI000B98A1A5|nr:TetR/AcrR family transcriptional regulator [Paenibacillus sp. XY044]OZB96039.1 TetR family transcriptional regulator [Paenibacillus sp. XY044]